MDDVDGPVVVITGGTRGIGAGIARAFLAQRARVVVCARHAPPEPIDTDGRTAIFVEADVRDPADAARVVMAARDAYGRLDTLVSNAGGSPQVAAAQASPRFHAKVIELNLVAALHAAQAANAAMQEQDGGGSVVFIGSVSGARPSPGTAAYGAAKAGLHHLATSLAIEWAPKVRVNTVVPGIVGTDAATSHYGAAPDNVVSTIPMGRMATPEDVARACMFLASPAAAYISGATLAVHGGGEPPAFLAAVTPYGAAPPAGST